MENCADFTRRLDAFKSNFDRSNISSMKLGELKKTLGDLFDIVLCGETAVNVMVTRENCLKDIKSSFGEFRDFVSASVNDLKRSYADTVRAGPRQSTELPQVVSSSPVSRPQQHVIVLKPEEGASSKVDPSQIKQSVKSALKSVQVSKVNFKDSGSVVLNFPSNAAKESAKVALNDHIVDNSDFRLKIKEQKVLLPKITVTNIPYNLKQEEIIPEMLRKNEKIDSLVKSGSSLSLCFVRERKKPESETISKVAVLEVAPEIRLALMESGFIYLEFNRCRLYDRFWVTQCFHCQKFGHTAMSCNQKRNNEDPVCRFCAGSHKASDCNRRSIPKCANCARVNEHSDHFASSESCPILKSQKQIIIDNTVLTPSKN